MEVHSSPGGAGAAAAAAAASDFASAPEAVELQRHRACGGARAVAAWAEPAVAAWRRLLAVEAPASGGQPSGGQP